MTLRSDDLGPLSEQLAAQATPALSDAPRQDIVTTVKEMIAHPEYPCLGARSVFKRDSATIEVFDNMDADDELNRLREGLREFASHDREPREFASFVAVFRRPIPTDERDFESHLWQVLQRLHDADSKEWSNEVSNDPDEPNFAFSLGGTAFFIVGLHPKASRIARRAPLPTLVFNLHEQFEELRREGGFDRMRDAIRRRDSALQGDINPVVADHGTSSEARQYSGRHVEDDWQAPFTP